MKILVTGAKGLWVKTLSPHLMLLKMARTRPTTSLKNGKVFQFDIYASVQNGVNFCKEENFNL